MATPRFFPAAGDLGDPLRIIEVEPLVSPVPDTIPEELPDPVPDLEPATVEDRRS
jgi:hypothetical protein